MMINLTLIIINIIVGAMYKSILNCSLLIKKRGCGKSGFKFLLPHPRFFIGIDGIH